MVQYGCMTPAIMCISQEKRTEKNLKETIYNSIPFPLAKV